MRILVPLDGSPQAEQALLPAIQMLRRDASDGDVILLRVVPHPSAESLVTGTLSPLAANALLNESIATSDAYLTRVIQRREWQDLAVSTQTEVGNPAQCIVAVAWQRLVDFIVLTSSGRSGLAHLISGSVAETVIRDAHLPTLLVRPGRYTFPDTDTDVPLTVLVPLDGSPLAEGAIPIAVRLTSPFAGVLHLMRVLPEWAKADHPLAIQAWAYLTTIHDRLQAQGTTTHRDLAWGDPADEIAEAFQRHQIDLIVMTTHGQTGLAHLVPGSVAQAILHRTDMPLVLMHPPTPSHERPEQVVGAPRRRTDG